MRESEKRFERVRAGAVAAKQDYLELRSGGGGLLRASRLSSPAALWFSPTPIIMDMSFG